MFSLFGTGAAYQEAPKEEKKLDQSIIYNIKNKSAHEYIDKLKKMNIKMDQEEEELAKIEELISEQIENNLQKKTNNPKYNLEEALRIDYSVANVRLNGLVNVLKTKYEDYFRIMNKITQIQEILAATDDKNFDEIIDSLLMSLGLLRTSSNVVYDKEKEIVEKFYNIIYKVMKLEILYTGKTRLFNEIKKDDTDTHYIVNELLKDVEELNNSRINSIIRDIQCEGIDDGLLLDESLIFLIAAMQNPEVIASQHEEFELSKEEMEELKKEIELQVGELESAKEEAKGKNRKVENLKKQKRNKTIKTGFNAILLAAGMAGVVAGADKLTTGTDYYTTVKQYDTSTGTTTVSDPTYTKGTDEREVIIEEYGQWDNPGYFRNDKWERPKYTFYVDDLDEIYDNPEDYLDTKFKGQFNGKTTTEYSKEMPEDYGTYEGNKYIVTITEKNLEDSQPGRRPVKFALALLMGLGGIAGIQTLVIKKSKDKKIKVIKEQLAAAREEKDIQDGVVEALQKKLDELKNDQEELRKKIEHQRGLVSRFEDKESVKKEYKKDKRTT